MNNYNNKNDFHESEFDNKSDNAAKNKKHLIILGITTLTLFIVIILVIVWQKSATSSALVDNSLSGEKYSNNAQGGQNSDSSKKSDETSPTQLPLYLLGEWEGKLAVFHAFGSEPFETYEVYVTTFPQEEQDKLLEGIKVYSEEELASLIEDYTS